MKKTICIALTFLIFFACRKNNSAPPPSLLSLDPATGAPGNFISIHGSGFDSLASGNSVSFNGLNSTVNYVSGDTLLIVTVPPGATTGKISVTNHNQTTNTTGDFVILSGTWIKKADFPDQTGRINPLGFAIGDLGYMGFGGYDASPMNDLYAYNPSSNSWTQRASLPIPLIYGVAVVVQGKAYIGIGNSSGGYTNKFFEYEPVANSYTAKVDFPGVNRNRVLGIAIGDKVFVGLGTYPNVYNDFWEFDPAANLWTRKADCPGAASIADFSVGFSLNDSTAFIGRGQLNHNANWWMYNAKTNSWIQKNDLPFHVDWSPGTMVVNNNGYFLNGWQENWLYNPDADSWTQKAFFTARGAGASFTVDNKAYFGLGSGMQSPVANEYINHDLWEFTP